MPQLTFTWPAHASYALEDFIPSPSNETAVAFIDSWPTGVACAALLYGPPSCGKTHLAQRWAARVGAIAIDKATLGTAPSEQLLQQAHYGVLEDIETITNAAALFHLLRHAETQQAFLLLTSRFKAAELPFTLPDLRSRLMALPGGEIHAPDEALLHAFLMKCFSDRQLRVGEDVIRYTAKRTERSFAGAAALVDRIARSSIETKREITIPLVKPLVESA